VAQAKELAGKGTGVVGARLEVSQYLGGELWLKVERKVVLTVDRPGNQLGFGKDHVGPALALLVEAQDLCRELRTIHYLEIYLTSLVGEKILVDLSAIQAGGVQPDSDPILRRRRGGRWSCQRRRSRRRRAGARGQQRGEAEQPKEKGFVRHGSGTLFCLSTGSHLPQEQE